MTRRVVATFGVAAARAAVARPDRELGVPKQEAKHGTGCER